MPCAARYLLLGAALTLSGCSSGPVVTIDNRASVTLSNLVVPGAGFTNYLDTLSPGQSHKLTIHPKGETGVRLRGEAGGRQIDSGEGHGYCESSGGYRVKLTVETNLSTSITVTMRGF